jgi:DNA-binding HxlR family transcriptional regulator
VKSAKKVCPHYHGAVELIGRRWTGAILYALTDGPLRFAELKQAVPGMSDRLLSARLKELEQAGLVTRTVHDAPPVKVSYGLTLKGESLEPVIGELRDWARRWHRA